MNERRNDREPAVPLLVGVVVIGFFVLRTDVYLDRRGWLPVPSSILFAVCAVALYGLQALISQRTLRKSASLLVANRASLWPLGLMAALSMVGVFQSGTCWDEGGKYVFLTVFDAFVLLVSLLWATLGWLRSAWKPILRVVLVLFVATVSVDLFVPGLFSDQLARGAGLAVNPNDAAFLIVLYLALAVRYDRLHALDTALAGLGAFGVFLTLSRGGIVLLGFFIAAWLGMGVRAMLLGRDRRPVRRLGALLVVVSVLAGLAVVAVDNTSMLQRHVAQERVAQFLGREHYYESDENRLQLVDQYLGLIEEHPWFGFGTAHHLTRELGAHNMFLTQWVDNGVFAAAAFVWWLAAAAGSFWKRRDPGGVVFIGVVALECLFSHNVLDIRTS